MTNVIKTVAAAAAAFSLAAPGIAEQAVETAFTYDRSVSEQNNYERISETASRACDALHPRRTTSFTSAYNRLKKDCRSDMIDAAVKAINEPVLTALHEDRSVDARDFASLN